MELDQLHASCPSCGESLYRRRGQRWSIATRGIVFLAEDGAVAVKCDRCGSETPIPFLTVSPPAKRRRRLVLPLDTGDATG